MSDIDQTHLIFTLESDQNTLVANFGPYLPLQLNNTATSILVAADRAQQAVIDANTAATQSAQYTAAAQSSSGSASTSASQSLSYSNIAKSQADNAAASATSAASSASQAATSASAADAAVTSVSGSASAAQAAANQASNSATTAASSAASAQTAATNATNAVSSISTYATAAANSASAASISAQNAKRSETNANASASSALDASTLAGSNASLASASAATASSAASSAGTSATNSSNSAALAQKWASQETGAVDGTEYSAKYYALQAALAATGVSSFNTRTGAVSLIADDVSGVGAVMYDTSGSTKTLTLAVPSVFNGTATYNNVSTFGGEAIFNNATTYNSAVAFNSAITFANQVTINGTISLNNTTTVNGPVTFNTNSVFNTAPTMYDPLKVTSGGTGVSVIGSPGQMLVVNTTGDGMVWASPTSGAVTSVAVSSPDLTVSGSPITSNGTISLSINTVPISKGGTGAITASGALTALGVGSNATPTFYGLTLNGSSTKGLVLGGGNGVPITYLASVATGSVLLSAGTNTAPIWGKVDLTSTVTGVLPLANGGTSTSTAPTTGQVLQATSTTAAAWTSQPYDISFYIEGTTTASEVVLYLVAARAFTWPKSLASSYAKANTAAKAAATFSISRNGTSIGSFAFAASGTSATFTLSNAVTFAAGDVIQITAPATPDTTLANIAITFAGTR